MKMRFLYNILVARDFVHVTWLGILGTPTSWPGAASELLTVQVTTTTLYILLAITVRFALSLRLIQDPLETILCMPC